MIMTRNDDGTYSQVGFIKDSDGNDTEYIYDKDGTVLFEKGFTREKSGSLPLQLDGIGKDLKDYTIRGNTVQNGSPTPDNPVEVHAVGDRTGNLFDGEIQQGGLGDTNGAIATSSNRVMTTKINVTENTYYTATSNLMIRNIIAYNNGTFVSRLVGSTSDIAVFSIPVGVNQIAISFKGNEEGTVEITPNDLEWLMLNEGTEPLPYEPYGYKIPITTESEDGTESITTTAYLDKPLYKIGDYTDSINYAEQKAERVVKELVLTGGEDWKIQSINEYGIANFYFYTSESDNFVRNLHALNSHFVYQTTLIAQTTGEGMYMSNNNIIYIRIKQERASTVTDFESYLAAQYSNGTPVKIYYVLATPETESVTLPKIPTLDGTAVIDVETEIEPSNMNVKYKSRR